MLQGLGVRYAMVHRSLYADRRLADRTVEALRLVAEGAAFDNGDLTVVRLAPRGARRAVSGGRIPSSDFTATASENAASLAAAFDGRVRTRWRTAGPQRGDERIELRLDRPRDVQRLQMLVAARSTANYPRRILVEGSENGDSFRTLFDGPVLPLLGEGFARAPLHPAIEIDLPANRTTILRVRQTLPAPWYWCLDELNLFERTRP